MYVLLNEFDITFNFSMLFLSNRFDVEMTRCLAFFLSERKDFVFVRMWEQICLVCYIVFRGHLSNFIHYDWKVSFFEPSVRRVATTYCFIQQVK